MQGEITNSVGDELTDSGHIPDMLTSREILARLQRRLDAREIRKADIARALDLPQSRIAEVFGGRRGLSADEAARLVNHFRLLGPVVELPSEETLKELMAQVQAEMPAGLPFAAWPEAAATALLQRLRLLAGIPDDTSLDANLPGAAPIGADRPSRSTRPDEAQ